MTENGNFKRRVRARAAKTGESYTAALRHLRRSASDDTTLHPRTVRLAVAQITACDDPRDIPGLRRCGQEMRRLMREAHRAGARLVHFPEGATCAPNKRIMSSTGREKIGLSDWSRFEWAVLREELEAIGALARDLRLWTVFGSVHPLTPPNRPHNSLYVVSDRGELVTRYDERMLSNTKISFMYAPGSIPVRFDVDGISFGCTLGMESHFAEIFAEYERLGVDCVLFSTTGGSATDDPDFAAEMQGHAAANSYWAGFAVHAQNSAPSGIVAPGGRWAAQCLADGTASIAVADVDDLRGNVARLWRRTARSGIYEPHLVDDDPRSGGRDTF